MSLYRNILNSISDAVYTSLHEMARQSILRTIDKKLWLSVSSTCSRNKSTEAEFIKPLGNDKNILLQKYVSALLIMKKDCPLSEDDIELLKTFKLVGKKLIELGVTFDEILKLYDENNGSIKTLLRTTFTTANGQSQEQKDMLSVSNTSILDTSKQSLFDDDDDLFGVLDGDDEEELLGDDILNKIIEAPKTMDLINVFASVFNTPRPRGWKFVKHTADLYDLFIKYDTILSYVSSKYIRDFVKVITLQRWTMYDTPRCKYSWSYNNIPYETIEPGGEDNMLSTAIKKGLIGNLSVNDIGGDTYNDYKTWLHEYAVSLKRFKDSITNKVVLDLFKKNPYIKRLYISPDDGVVYMHVRLIGNSGSSGMHIVTFTGHVNYSKSATDKKDIQRIKAQENTKKKFKKYLTKFNGLKNFVNVWNCIIKDDYPVLYNEYNATDSGLKCMKVFKSCPTLFREVPWGLFLNKNAKDEVLSTNECVNISLISDKYNQYPISLSHKKDYMYRCVIQLTDKGKEHFDKWEPVKR